MLLCFPFPLLKDAYLLLPLRFLQVFCVSLRSSSAYPTTEKSTFWIPREIIIFISYSLPLIYNLLSDNTCIYFVFLCNIYLFIQIYLLNVTMCEHCLTKWEYSRTQKGKRKKATPPFWNIYFSITGRQCTLYAHIDIVTYMLFYVR